MDGRDFNLKRTSLTWVIDCLCGVLLIGMTVWVMCCYPSLPDRIPIHYGIDGVIDGYGAKSMIWLLLGSMWFPACLLSVVERFPRYWNGPFKVTKENHVRLMALTWHFLGTIKLLVVCLFAYLVAKNMQGGNLSAYFTPIVMTAFIVNSLYWLVLLFRNR